MAIAAQHAGNSNLAAPAISSATLTIAPLTCAIGAEVTNINLGAASRDPAVMQDIRAALLRHKVLFFRDQKLTLDQHEAFGRQFGELAIHPNTPGPDGHPEILPIHADANSKRIAGERWHSDVSCDPEPPMGSILYIKKCPPRGGDTLFANMYAGEQVTLVFLSLTYLIAPAIFMGLHVFVSFLQAYIFALMTMMYVAGAVAHDH